MALRTQYIKRPRHLDWGCGLLILAMGLVFMQPGSQTATPTPIDDSTIGFLFVGLGAVRIAALAINGHWVQGWSALLRAMATIASAAIWSQVVYATAATALHQNQVTVGLTFAASMLLADLWCATRAGQDFASSRRVYLARMKPTDAANH